jgi:hypothetical protein
MDQGQVAARALGRGRAAGKVLREQVLTEQVQAVWAAGGCVAVTNYPKEHILLIKKRLTVGGNQLLWD